MPKGDLSYVEGLKELDAQLAALENPETAYQIGLAAVKASANLLKEAWIEAAPYDPKKRGAAGKYGNMRDNFRVGPVRAQNLNAVVFKTTSGNAYWAYWYEFGNSRQAARPWARPVVERLRPEFINLQIDIVNQGIADALAGRTGKA